MLSVPLIADARSWNGRGPRYGQGLLVLLWGSSKLWTLDLLESRSLHQHPHLCLLLCLRLIVGNLLL
jgi:hypothetical protein